MFCRTKTAPKYLGIVLDKGGEDIGGEAEIKIEEFDTEREANDFCSQEIGNCLDGEWAVMIGFLCSSGSISSH